MSAQPSSPRDALLHAESADTPIRPEDYVVVNGHRLVKPYHFDYCCGVRQRWLGQSIIDIFMREFPARGRDYYVQALADGRLRVEGCQVTAETPLREGQRMRHFIHRHEPPVPAGAIQVVGQSAGMVAVCKPHGMPVHVSGQFRKNTVLGILTAERPDLGPLFPVHRLDKPVSGLLLFARSAAAAATLCQQIESRGVQKVYVARVLGRFPASDQLIVADVPLDWDPVSNMATAVPQAAVAVPAAAPAAGAAAAEAAVAAGAGDAAGVGEEEEVARDGMPAAQQQGQLQQHQEQEEEQQQGEQPTALRKEREERKLLKKQQRALRRGAKAERQAAAKEAAAAAAKKPSRGAPKQALTEFRLLAVAADGLTSIVECRPRTGRTHQIRVHLQHLGHPIANDVQYGGTYGGPMAARQMARELGVHWGGGNSGSQGGTGNGAAAAEADAEAVEAAEAGERSKRPRLGEAPGPVAAAGGQQQPVVDSQQRERQEGDQAPGNGTAAGAARRDAEAYAQNAVFRLSPEYRLPAELCDALCTHCPYYAPSYSCLEEGGWSFATELPEWAHADWLPPPAE